MEFQSQAQTLVRDILAYVLAGRIDEEARITFAGWITDAVEAAVEAKATELSEAVGFAGAADADIVRDRIAGLRDTLGQLFRWVAAALPVVSAAYAVVEQPDQLAALAQAVGHYRTTRGPSATGAAAWPVPRAWLNAIAAAVAAPNVGDDRYGREVAGLEALHMELTATFAALPPDLAGYRCVFFKAARPGDRPIALFERAVFAAQFIAANPGRFREEDQTQDWLTLGDWLRLPTVVSASAADADGLTASIVAASYEFECEHCGEFSPVGEALLPLYSTVICRHCGAAHTVVSLPG